MTEEERRAKKAAYMRSWAAKNRDKVKRWKRRYYEKNKEEHLKKCLARYEAKREEILEKQKNRYPSVAHRRRQTSRAWAARNRDKRKAYEKKRRAITRGAAAADFTATDWKKMVASYGNRCAYCLEIFQNLTQDHVVPVSAGGTHTRENIVPACAPCNQGKHTSLIEPRLRIYA